MTLNERILDFLDGSLPGEDEAELLHTLSVSPEKRGMLRGFMEQRTLLTRDAKSLSVPYETERRLWARMDQVLPITVNEEATTVVVPVAAPSAGFFAHALSGASATLGAFTLVAGIGIGYFAGHSQTTTVSVPKVVTQTAPIESNVSHNTIPDQPNGTYKSYVSHETHVKNIAKTNVALALSVKTPLQNVAPVPPSAATSDSNVSPITTVTPASTPVITLADIGGDGEGIKPMLHKTRMMREASTTLLSRFEFRIDESFGRQFPNSIATNVSLPIITNTSITTFFQVFPHSNLFWAGASYGSANITRKDLFAQAGDSIDPSQAVLASDTVHSQTSYVAALAELRLPAFETTDLTFTAGYGLATLGQMMFGEIGLHYDVSSQAGIQCGIRVLRFTYDLSAEKAAAIASGNGSLAISNPVVAASPSINTELNAGLFFHF